MKITRRYTQTAQPRKDAPFQNTKREGSTQRDVGNRYDLLSWPALSINKRTAHCTRNDC